MREATAQYSRSVRLETTRYETSPANAAHAAPDRAKPARTETTRRKRNHSVPRMRRANEMRCCARAYTEPVSVFTPAAATYTHGRNDDGNRARKVALAAVSKNTVAHPMKKECAVMSTTD